MGWIIGGGLAVAAFLVWFGLVQLCEGLAGEVA